MLLLALRKAHPVELADILAADLSDVNYFGARRFISIPDSKVEHG